MSALWFHTLCHEHGLTPIDPVRADELAPGNVLFTATGEPRTVQSVRVMYHTVLVAYDDGWHDRFRRDDRIALIARPMTNRECAWVAGHPVSAKYGMPTELVEKGGV